MPQGSRSLLDVGTGDGVRARRIAAAAAIRDLTLLEPSPAMRNLWSGQAKGWAIRAEELSQKDGVFDVVTCLWNVLGHIFPAENRVEVLRQFARLLSRSGVAFVDVNHRYNIRHYGILPNVRNGDVLVRWRVGDEECVTKGHVFTHGEIRRLMKQAGLSIRRVISVDYESGEIRRCKFNGNLLYILSRPIRA